MVGASYTSRSQLARALRVVPESRGRRLLRDAATVVAAVVILGGVVLLAILSAFGG